MGLLDMFGQGFEDPKSQAIMAMSAGLMGGTTQSMAQGLLNSNAAFNTGRDRQLQQEQLARKAALQDEELNNARADRTFALQQRDRQEAFKKLLPTFLGEDGKLDAKAVLEAGGTIDDLKNLSAIRGLGAQKVARTIDTVGPNGQKMTIQLDDSGRQVGAGFAGYEKPERFSDGQNMNVWTPGGPVQTIAPMRLSPGEQITMRGQDMTDKRSRDANAQALEQSRSEQGIKADDRLKAQAGAAASYETALATLDRLATHPGMNRSVGMNSVFPTVPGSQSANFQAELESFKAQSFLPMVQSLKGMGPLSDAEGKKLTAAVGALDVKMSKEAFVSSIRRIKSDLEASRMRVGPEEQQTQTQPKSAPKWGAMPTINSPQELTSLPSGTVFRAPDGSLKVKP